MRIAWVTRSFLDYRIPVFKELDKLVENSFYLVFSKDYIPNRVYKKIKDTLGDRAIGLTGEWKMGHEDKHSMANKNISFRFHPSLYKTIKRLNPDVLIGDGFFKWTFASILYKLRHKTPLVICYERTPHVERNAQWYRTLFRRLVVKITDAMCCNGQLCGEYARSLGMRSDKITYGHMVADTNNLSALSQRIDENRRINFREKYGINNILFLYVGRLIRLKGLKELLAAWKKIEEMTNEASLILVGDGPDKLSLYSFCKDYNLKNVYFVGNVSYDEIVTYYTSADVFIIPTLEDNWSLVVPEAMACGLPILCSKYNGCWPELIKDGQNGWVFDPLNKDDTVKVLTWCLHHQDELPRMGDRSKEIVKPFNAENAARSIYNACKIALNHRKTSTFP